MENMRISKERNGVEEKLKNAVLDPPLLDTPTQKNSSRKTAIMASSRLTKNRLFHHGS